MKKSLGIALVVLLAGAGGVVLALQPSGLQAELISLSSPAEQARAYQEEQKKKEAVFRKELREAPLRATGVEKADGLDLSEIKAKLRAAAANGGRSVEIYRERVGDDEFWGDAIDFMGHSLTPEIRNIVEAPNSRRAEFAAMADRLKNRLGLRVAFSMPDYGNRAHPTAVIWASW